MKGTYNVLQIKNASEYFWFTNFEPDMIIEIHDDELCKYIKKYFMEIELKINRGKDIYYDPQISAILNAYTYYICLRDKKTLINYLNKNGNLDIDPYTLNIQITLDDGNKFNFIESEKSNRNRLASHRAVVQTYHNYRHYYLKIYKARTTTDFNREFNAPIIGEMYGFFDKSLFENDSKYIFHF